jgi:hypothetical protein
MNGMNTKDLELVAGLLAGDLKQFTAKMIAEAVDPMRARCEALERELMTLKAAAGMSGERGPAGRDGVDGKDADLSLLMALQSEVSELRGEWQATKAWQPQAKAVEVADEGFIARIKSEVLRDLPVPKDGRDGVSIDPAVVDAMVQGAMAVAIKSLPAPKDGAPGADGQPGRDGEPGPQGPVGDVGPAGPEGPAGRDGAPGEKGMDGRDGAPGTAGAPGEKGMDGRDGAPGTAGAPGEKGADGLGVSDLLIDMDGALVATFTDGRTKTLGVVRGQPGEPGQKGLDGRDGVDGTPGRDGVDGLGFEDLTFDEDDAGRAYVKFVRGDLAKSHRLPSIIDRGVWRQGEKYLKGDGVTWRGGFSIAQTDTTDQPGESKAWRLAVRPGRDGKPGPPGKSGGDE